LLKLFKINVNIVVKQSGFNLEYSGDNSLLTNEIGNISFKNIEKSVDELIIYYKSTFSSAQLENFRKLHSE
jgi:hypothetical protein